MLSGYIIASLVIAVALFLLGCLVLLRNPKSKPNQTYLAFSTLTAFWLITNYAAGAPSVPETVALVCNHLTFFFGLLATFALLVFVRFFRSQLLDRSWKWIVAANTIAALLALTPLTISGIVPTSTTYEITFGWAAIPFFAVLVGNCILVIATLVRTRKHATGSVRSQIDVIFGSLLLALSLILITNAAMPLLLGEYRLTEIGSFSIVIVVIGIAYGIIRHQLFNIRLVVARSLGYLLSIVVVAALYGLITFTILSRFLFREDAISGLQQLFYTLLAVIIAFTFPPIKKFFDRTTNRIFYRDAYDPQQLLDDLNKTLVSTIELRTLLRRVSDIIAGTLKADYAMFDIKQPNGHTEHVVASPEGAHINKAELAFIRKEAPTIRKKILLTDELEDHPRLQKVLRDNNIALIAHMVDSPKQEQAGLGYLLLGTKKSGNPYSSEDVRIMEIIADELVIAVQNALRFDEIKDFNLTLQQKVEEATRKLRRTNEKLKQLDETKDDFISMASHQLRTPLTSVKGYVSMVLEGDAGKITPQQRKLLDQAFVSSQRMVFLIADLLNVSRLKTGKFIIEPKPTNLSEVVAGEIEQLVETAKGRELTLSYHKPHDFPVLNLDETKTRQVVMNFVDNAIYYTPAGGHITVNLVDKPESIELTVVDDGLGVPKAEQPHLFTKFYRARNAKKARPDGTGLGLFMAKKVIIAQGGAIIFKSQEGKGSTFGFSFPKSKLLVKDPR